MECLTAISPNPPGGEEYGARATEDDPYDTEQYQRGDEYQNARRNTGIEEMACCVNGPSQQPLTIRLTSR
jgi:hypothetical protein